MKAWSRLAGTLALLVLSPCIANAQATPPAASAEAPPEVFATGAGGVVVHRASGFGFPDRLGDMPRRKFRVYASDDVDASYTLRGGANGDPWLNLFVYPAPRSVEEEAAIVEGELVKHLSATPLATQPRTPPNAPGAIGRWFEGRYEGRSLTSGYVLVKRGRWYLLVRGSSPKEAGAQGIKRLLDAIAAVEWGWTGDAQRPSGPTTRQLH